MTVPSGLQSHVPSLVFSMGLQGEGGLWRGTEVRALPAKSHLTRLSLRAQAPAGPQRTSLDQVELTAGQVLYIEWNLLDTASRINFFPLFKDV